MKTDSFEFKSCEPARSLLVNMAVHYLLLGEEHRYASAQ